MNNVYAPQAVNGLNYQPPEGYYDVGFDGYVFDIVLQPGQLLRDQAILISNDADFELRAYSYTQPTGDIGAFLYRLSDGQGNYLSNAMIANTNMSPFPDRPTVMFPGLLFVRGGMIGIDIQNLDLMNTNTIQIVFRGVKRYRAVKAA